MLDLERVMEQIHAERAKQRQDGGRYRFQPATTDPEGCCHGEHSEQHGNDAQGELARSGGDDHDALRHQPAERRALSEPQRTGQVEEFSIAYVERDHFFVQP